VYLDGYLEPIDRLASPSRSGDEVRGMIDAIRPGRAVRRQRTPTRTSTRTSLNSEKKVVEGRPKVDEMNTEAEAYFAAWKQSAAEISNADLRKRSEQRLADAQARFQKIAAAGKDAQRSFDTLMKDVKDQSTFLGHDLNANTIATLKPDAARFNTRANTVFTKIDGVTKMYEEYIASMKP
jgi:DNA repair ATPase RecN